MAAILLFCKRLIPRPNIYCSSLRHYGRALNRIGSLDYNVSDVLGSMWIRFELIGGEDGLDSPNLTYCNTYLKVLLRPPHGSSRIAKQYLAQMLVLGTIPGISTFSIIIRSYCQNHKYHDVLDLVGKQMKALEVKANASFCRALMLAACACYQPYACHYLFQRLRSSYQGQLPLACYDAIFRKFCPRKRIKDGTTMMVLLHELSRMKQLGVYPDEKIYHMLHHARKLLSNKHINFDDEEKLENVVLMGSVMFTQGIRIGAVIPTTAYKELYRDRRNRKMIQWRNNGNNKKRRDQQ